MFRHGKLAHFTLNEFNNTDLWNFLKKREEKHLADSSSSSVMNLSLNWNQIERLSKLREEYLNNSETWISICASETILQPPVMYTCAIRDYISHALNCPLIGTLIGNATLLISQIERAHFFKSAGTKFTLTRKAHFFRQVWTTCVNKKKSFTTLKFRTSISLVVNAFEGFFYDDNLTYLYSTQNSQFPRYWNHILWCG